MAVTSGFFDSRNGDRKYNADQMSEYFRGIVSGGVFQHLDGGLQVTAGTGLAVNVAAGRAIVQNRWIQNSASLPLSISAASETYGRKDAVVLRLDSSARTVSITVKTGTPAASPAAPEMTRSGGVYEMALAYVNVAAGATSVTVTDKRSDSTVCGWATVAQSTSGEVDQMLNDMKTGFDGVEYSSPAAMVTGEDQKLNDKIGESDETFEELFSLENIYQHLHWRIGDRTTTTIKRLYTLDFYKTHENEYVESDQDWYFYIVYFNSSYEMETNVGWLTGKYTIDTTYPYYQIAARNVNSSMDMILAYGDHYRSYFESKIVDDVKLITNGSAEIDGIWELGSIENGQDVPTAKRLRTHRYMETSNTSITVDDEWFIYVIYYDDNKIFKKSVGWIAGTYVPDTNYKYFRLVLRNTNSSMDMNVSYAEHVSISEKSIYSQFDEKISPFVPGYLLDTVNDAISSGNTEYSKPVLMFPWITDSHLNPARQQNVRVWENTMKATSMIAENLPIRFILHTGDYIDQDYFRSDGATNAEVFNALSRSIRDIYDIDTRILIANGNHDGVSANGYGNIQWFFAGNGAVNSEYVERQDVPNSYTYKDFKDIKTRVITMSCPDSNTSNTYYWGFSHEQIQWLANEALNTPIDYGVIITIHTPMYQTVSSRVLGHVDIIYGIFNAYDSHGTFEGTYSDGTQTQTVSVDYTAKTGCHVVACLAGHTHGDGVIEAGETFVNGQTNELPCPVIVSGAAWFDAVGENGYTTPTRTYNTESEILFNLVRYYPTEKEMIIKRIGAGEDMIVSTN